MWPLGHAAVAYLCYSGSSRYRSGTPPALAVVVLGFASSLPDLVDKPLAWYVGVLPAGRSLAHSLLVLVPLSLGVYLLARRRGRGELGVAFAVGVLSHTLVDAVPTLWGAASTDPLLWPLTAVGGGGEEGAPTILGLLLESLPEPWFQFEFVLAAVALLLWTRDGYPGLDLLTVVRKRSARAAFWR